jgi:effector-binding domain-containing protein
MANGTSNVIQRYTKYSDTYPNTYIRTRTGGTWTAWRRVITEDDLASYATSNQLQIVSDAIEVQNISSIVDLNTYDSPGSYKQLSNSRAASGANYPEPSGGVLVINGDFIHLTQEYTTYNHSYRRYRFNDVWMPWKRIVTSSGIKNWIPTIPGGTMTVHYATYEEVGEYIRVWWDCTVTNIGVSDWKRMGGLPFPCGSEFGLVNLSYYDGSANSNYNVDAYVEKNDDIIIMKAKNVFSNALGSNMFIGIGLRFFGSALYKKA